MKLKAYAAHTHSGPYRNLNEDDYEVDLTHQLYLIFDGYGGQGVGDFTVKLAKEYIKNFYTRIAPDPDATMPFYYSPKYLLEGNALINALRFAHKMIFDLNRKKELHQRGGASCTALAMADQIVTCISTGNCVCYVYRSGELRRLVDEDSLFCFTSDHFYRHLKTAPLSGIGLFEDLHYTVREFRVLEDDLFLLMSDGIYSYIEHQELCHHITSLYSRSTLQEMLERLFSIANSRGNLDNQTALFLRF